MVKQLAQGHKLLDALLEKEPKPAALGPALLTTTLFLTATCTKCLSGLPDAAPEMWTQARTTQGSRLPRHHPSSPPCFPPALVDEARSPLELWTPSTPFLSETPLPHQSASICSFSIPASSTYAYVSSFPKANCPESSVAINTLLSLSSSLRLKKDLILGSLLPHLLLPPPQALLSGLHPLTQTDLSQRSPHCQPSGSLCYFLSCLLQPLLRPLG